MKNLIALVGLTALMAVPSVHADDADFSDVINWKVGDSTTYTVTSSNNPTPGTMTKKVSKDDGDGTLWVNETSTKESADIQIRKSDGAVLQRLVNGQPKPMQNAPLTLVSQDKESVTVPAGTFNTLHTVSKGNQNGKAVQMDSWVDSQDTCMDGTVKSVMTSPDHTMTRELTGFHKN